MKNPDHDKYLTTRQVAKVYGVAPRTIREWVEDGTFAPHELAPRKGKGKHHRFVPPTAISTSTA